MVFSVSHNKFHPSIVGNPSQPERWSGEPFHWLILVRFTCQLMRLVALLSQPWKELVWVGGLLLWLGYWGSLPGIVALFVEMGLFWADLVIALAAARSGDWFLLVRLFRLQQLLLFLCVSLCWSRSAFYHTPWCCLTEVTVPPVFLAQHFTEICFIA